MNKLFALLLLSQGMVFSSFASSPAAATSAPALVSAYLGTKGGANTMVAGATLQIIAYGIYSDGSTGTLPDAQGNVVTAWNTTNHAVAKISSLGHATALAAGTVSIEATVGTLIASPWSVTVSKAPVSANAPTLVSVYLGTNGSANTMVTGSTLQIIAHSIYSDGSTGTLPDAQGNVVTAWNTTNHAVAKISSLGHATALGAGPVNMEGTVGTLIASPWSVTVSNAPATVVPSSPNASCSANPSIINQGGTAVITATGGSPQNLPLTYSYSASAGSISGASTTATLETTGTSAGIVTVTCTVDQEGGGTASATTAVLLQSITGEQALTNFQFTDSVGVNVHLADANTVYGSQFPQIMTSMLTLGVTHYRDGLTQYAQPFQYQNAEMLGKAGIKADWLMDFNNSAANINSAYANAPDATAGFEGPNEDDAEDGAPLLAFMQLLQNTVRATPATAAMPIIAPSFIQASSYAAQGNLSSLINLGNTHDYFGTRNPETAPYGGAFYHCGGYGSMQFDMCLAELVGVNELVVSTETGYESGAGLSDAIIGRYELRTLFESLSLGMSKTYLYELIDDPSGNWGLLTGAFSPRPAYTAIENVLSLLKDVSFPQPGKLNYVLAGETQNVDHLLLQKSNGTFYLAIWLAVQSADPDNPSTAYNVPPQNLTLSTNTPIAGSTAYVLDDSGNLTSSSTELTNGSLPIAVTDRITLIALSPGQSN
jgi:Bacterial Ig-like domain (group 2)